MYYWDPMFKPVITGNDDSNSGVQDWSVQYTTTGCSKCFYGSDAVSGNQIYSIMFSCVDIPNEGLRESLWISAKSNI